MIKKIDLTCIGCPRGCALTATLEDGAVTAVEGNNCKIGDTYARKEAVSPTRIVTGTMRLEDGRVVSCKTDRDIPKPMVFTVAAELKKTTAKAPVKIGDVLIKNVADTGADIVATRDIC